MLFSLWRGTRCLTHEKVEANQLGAPLLMPRGLVQTEIKKNDLDLDDEEAIILLAKRFPVSATAMTNRLMKKQYRAN
jgi:Zn-dependent peptidase ImmA (M78 family)